MAMGTFFTGDLEEELLREKFSPTETMKIKTEDRQAGNNRPQRAFLLYLKYFTVTSREFFSLF